MCKAIKIQLSNILCNGNILSSKKKLLDYLFQKNTKNSYLDRFLDTMRRMLLIGTLRAGADMALGLLGLKRRTNRSERCLFFFRLDPFLFVRCCC